MCSIERLFARMFVRLTCCVSCAIARARSFVCDHGRARRGHVVAVARRRALDVVAVAVACPSWPSVMPWLCPSCRGVPGCGRRDVAVASLGMAVACRGRGCGVRRLCVAVVWLRHADGC